MCSTQDFAAAVQSLLKHTLLTGREKAQLEGRRDPEERGVLISLLQGRRMRKTQQMSVIPWSVKEKDGLRQFGARLGRTPEKHGGALPETH